MKSFKNARAWIKSLEEKIITGQRGNRLKREKLYKLSCFLKCTERNLFKCYRVKRSESQVKYGKMLRESDILDSRYGYPAKALGKGVIASPSIDLLICGNIVSGMELCSLDNLQKNVSEKYFSKYEDYWIAIRIDKIWHRRRYPRIVKKILVVRKYNEAKKEIIIKDIEVDSFRGHWLKRNLAKVEVK